MTSELTPIDIAQVPELAKLVDEVHQTRRPRRITRNDEDLALLMPAPPATPRRRTAAPRPRTDRHSVTDRTAGALKAYRLPRPLTPDEERDAFAQGVADEVGVLTREHVRPCGQERS